MSQSFFQESGKVDGLGASLVECGLPLSWVLKMGRSLPARKEDNRACKAGRPGRACSVVGTAQNLVQE